jgi:hypothetical protein
MSIKKSNLLALSLICSSLFTAAPSFAQETELSRFEAECRTLSFHLRPEIQVTVAPRTLGREAAYNCSFKKGDPSYNFNIMSDELVLLESACSRENGVMGLQFSGQDTTESPLIVNVICQTRFHGATVPRFND